MSPHDPVIEALFLQQPAHTFQKNTVVVPVGSEPPGVMYLAKGLVKQFGLTANGKEILYTLYKPGSFFPLTWAVAKVPNKFGFQCSEDCVIHIIPPEVLERFLSSHPISAYTVLKRVLIGLDALMSKVEMNSVGTAEQKVALTLVQQIKRFSSDKHQLSIHESEVAATAGVTRETVSRALTTMKAEHLITFEKGVLTVLDWEKLQNLSTL